MQWQMQLQVIVLHVVSACLRYVPPQGKVYKHLHQHNNNKQQITIVHNSHHFNISTYIYIHTGGATWGDLILMLEQPAAQNLELEFQGFALLLICALNSLDLDTRQQTNTWRVSHLSSAMYLLYLMRLAAMVHWSTDESSQITQVREN